MSIVVSVVAGWVLLIGAHVRDPELRQRAGQRRHRRAAGADLHRRRRRRPAGKLLLLIVIGAQLFCGMASVTANSRMIYAFSRDGALPASHVWHRINPRTRTPTNAIWLAAGGAFILGLPYLWNVTAYAAVTSIAVIGLYIAYVLPTFLRLRQGDAFEPGPWHLGRWSRPIGIIAVAWVAFITVLFMLPQVSPVDGRDLQLHAGRRARRPRLRRHLVAGLGAELVHRPEGPGHAGGAGRGRAGAGEPCLSGRGTASSPSRTCVIWSSTARSTPSSSRSPTCRAGCRASGCTRGTSWTSSWSTPPRACNYLLAVDVDMNTVDGYAMSSWSSGYGDFVMRPDLSTLRPVPWQPGDGDGARRPRVGGRQPRRRLAAPGARAADGAAGRRRDGGLRRHRAGVPRLPRHLRAGVDAPATATSPRPTSTTSTTRCSAPPGSSRCCAASATT